MRIYSLPCVSNYLQYYVQNITTPYAFHPISTRAWHAIFITMILGCLAHTELNSSAGLEIFITIFAYRARWKRIPLGDCASAQAKLTFCQDEPLCLMQKRLT